MVNAFHLRVALQRHGGDTEVVFERVQRPNDPQTYYLEVSRYVISEPSYFEPVDLEPVQ